MKTYTKTSLIWLKFIILIVSFFLSFVLFSSKTHASTQINSDIEVDTHWLLSESPYIIENYVSVPTGLTLTVDPGVEVKFKQYSRLNVEGRLIANGTQDSKIHFTSAKESPRPNDDWGIFINGSSTPSLSNISISYSGRGLMFRGATSNLSDIDISKSGYGIDVQDSNITVTNLHAFDMEGDSVGGYTESFLDVSSSTIENMNNGSAVALFGSSTINLKDSLIRNPLNKTPLLIYGSTANIKDVIFDGSSSVNGAEMYDEDNRTPYLNVEDSTFQNFISGIYIWKGSANIKNSEIKDNEIGLENYSNLNTDATNNWWGSDTGPENERNATGTGNKIEDEPRTVNFIPWTGMNPPVQNRCCSSVLFIPGLEASRLYMQGNLFENKLWEPNRNADVEKLYLDDNGESINSIYTRDIVDQGIGYSIYKKFSDFLDDEVATGTIKEWKPLPYDWRMDLSDLATKDILLENGRSYKMLDEIEKIASSSNSGKVTLISHSNGGLLSKMLVEKLKMLGKSNLIDKVILVASPQLGTPKAIASMLHGDNEEILGGLILSKKNTRDFAKNMPGGYSLLPSSKFFNLAEGPVVEFDSSVSIVNNFIEKYGDKINSYIPFVDFLKGRDGRPNPPSDNLALPNILNSGLLVKSDSNHQLIDNWSTPQGINVYKLSGWGLPTLSGIKYTGEQDCQILSIFCGNKYHLDHQPINIDDGDKTVLSVSTRDINTPNDYYLDLRSFNNINKKNIEHQNIMEILPTQTLLKNILTNKNEVPDFITLNKPSANKIYHISVHSPVNLDAFDQEGHHTGLVSNADPNSDLFVSEENIPNSSYQEVGEGKYITLDGENSYQIKIKGNDLGTFTLNISETRGDIQLASSTFKDIPVTSSLKGSFEISGAIPNIISIDTNGDGQIDNSLNSNQKSDPKLMMEIFKNDFSRTNYSQDVKHIVINHINIALDFLNRNKLDDSIKFITKLEEELLKMKDKKITSVEYTKLISILEKIKLALTIN